MDGIKPHCMGMPFPEDVKYDMSWEEQMSRYGEPLPSAADLDAVAEEQRVKEITGAKE